VRFRREKKRQVYLEGIEGKEGVAGRILKRS
jgi:hypothetical protein